MLNLLASQIEFENPTNKQKYFKCFFSAFSFCQCVSEPKIQFLFHQTKYNVKKKSRLFERKVKKVEPLTLQRNYFELLSLRF